MQADSSQASPGRPDWNAKYAFRWMHEIENGEMWCSEMMVVIKEAVSPRWWNKLESSKVDVKELREKLKNSNYH